MVERKKIAGRIEINNDDFEIFFRQNFKFESQEKTFTRKQFADFCTENNFAFKCGYLYGNAVGTIQKLDSGLFKHLSIPAGEFVPVNKNTEEKPEVATVVEMKVVSGQSNLAEECVPEVNKTFVEFGFYADLCKIIESRQFFPTFITGLSGNGKTFGIEQSCAHLERKLVRVNITTETDEDDLLGGFRLVDGNTKWYDGPVIRAMKTGSILLLDEVDLASNKIMCLQPVLEGKNVFLKKINELVQPVDGFSIVATANTKGQGSDSGKFIGTTILNEAFLDRFPVTFEQVYPSEKIETKILRNVFQFYAVKEKEYEGFIKPLLLWAKNNRENFQEGNCSEVISTRRLVHIAQAYSIFKNKIQAINNCINRFDDENKTILANMYEKFDETVAIDKNGLLIDRTEANSSSLAVLPEQPKETTPIPY